MRKLYLAPLMVVCVSAPALPATIRVDSTSKDTVGQSVVYELREAISSSSQHKLVFTDEDAGFVINIVTVEDTKNTSTSYAAVLTMPQPNNKSGLNYYITTVVGNCGSSRTKECAKGVLASFDNQISEIASIFMKSLKEK